YLTKILHQLDTGSYAEPDRKARTQTFAQFVRETWRPAVCGSLRASTLASYDNWLERHVIPELGTFRLAEITPDRIQRLYRTLLQWGRTDGQGGLSAQSVRHVHVVLHRVLRDAVKWDRIGRNPADRVEKPTAERHEMSVWSAEQLRTFLAHVHTDRLY